MRLLRKHRRWTILSLVGLMALAGGGASTLLAVCGPFTDVPAGICGFVLEIYYLGITGGTGPTTYDPTSNVTRGQMAVFIAALHNNIKRNENPNRVATRNSNNIFNANYENYATVNTGAPNGFCTDGGYNFTANQTSTKIDISFNGLGSGSAGTYTTTTGNNRLACDGTYLYATSVYGTTIKRVNLHTGLVEDPWVSGFPGGTGDIANAGFDLAVTTGSGLSIVGKGGGAITNVDLGEAAFGVVVDNNGFYWTNTDTALKKIDQSGNILLTVPLTGSAGGNGYYPVFDGSSIWVPRNTNGIDIVRSDGVLIDHRTLGDASGSVGVVGGGFNGRYVFFDFYGDYGCGGTAGNLILAYDAATHNAVQAIGELCNDGVTYTLGFDGRYMHALAYNSPGKHYVW